MTQLSQTDEDSMTLSFDYMSLRTEQSSYDYPYNSHMRSTSEVQNQDGVSVEMSLHIPKAIKLDKLTISNLWINNGKRSRSIHVTHQLLHPKLFKGYILTNLLFKSRPKPT